jgi:hypothetical protein
LTLYISPLVGFIREQRGRRAVRWGLYHRLTGETHAVAPALWEAARRAVGLELDASMISRLRQVSPAREALDRMRQTQILTPSGSPADLIRPFADCRLAFPLANPALAYRRSDGAHVLVRLRGANRCLLPRSPTAPELVEELLDPAVHAAWTLLQQPPHADVTLGAFWQELNRRFPSAAGHESAWRVLDHLTRPERQILRVVRSPDCPTQARAPHNFLAQDLRWERPGPSARAPAKDFYETGIRDAAWNFDWTEPTVSHSFRFPTSALGGRSYGERFGDAVCQRLEVMPPRRLRILEVGGGLGTFALSFIAALARRGQPGLDWSYTIVDCSPALISHQQHVLADSASRVRYVCADARELSLAGEEFDVAISNEAIADFGVAESPGTGRRVAPRTLRQTGVEAFLRRLRGHLAPGGWALRVEYGELDRPPRRVWHLNHPEYSVEFAQILDQARGLGLQARVEPLAAFLQADPSALLLSGKQEHHWCLNHLLRRVSAQLAYAAYSRETFEAGFGEAIAQLSLTGVRCAPLGLGWHYGPELGGFWVVSLHRMPPAASAAWCPPPVPRTA